MKVWMDRSDIQGSNKFKDYDPTKLSDVLPAMFPAVDFSVIKNVRLVVFSDASSAVFFEDKDGCIKNIAVITKPDHTVAIYNTLNPSGI